MGKAKTPEQKAAEKAKRDADKAAVAAAKAAAAAAEGSTEAADETVGAGETAAPELPYSLGYLGHLAIVGRQDVVVNGNSFVEVKTEDGARRLLTPTEAEVRILTVRKVLA